MASRIGALSSEDEAILGVARRTCDRLGLAGFYPTIVFWQEVDYPGRRGAKVISPHFPVLVGSKLIMSPILRERVASEDWGLVLAPSLVFYRRLKRGYNIGTLIRLLPGLLLLLGFLLVGYLFIPHPDTLLVVGWIATDVALLILGVYSSIRLSRRLVLQADKEAASVIGTGSLTEALQNLEHLREVDASRGISWPEYGDHPSLNKRIANLQNL